MRRWVEEKTGGRIKADDVASIGLDLIRREGPAGVAELLRGLSGNRPVIVNAASERDLEGLAGGADRRGGRKRFLHRTAAAWLRTRADRAALALRGDDLPKRDGPGLIVAGSYVGRTSEQLDALLAPGDLTHFQLPIAPLLDARRPEFIAAAIRSLADTLNAGRDAVLFTAREHAAGATQKKASPSAAPSPPR
ncbi:MAG: nucleotide-binding domain containing protein [Thermomicrobiales bacterium]